jgi:hypothetical protein
MLKTSLTRFQPLPEAWSYFWSSTLTILIVLVNMIIWKGKMFNKLMIRLPHSTKPSGANLSMVMRRAASLAAHEINQGFSRINEINASRSGWVASAVNLGIARVEESKQRPDGWADRPAVERGQGMVRSAKRPGSMMDGRRDQAARRIAKRRTTIERAERTAEWVD